MGERHHGFGVYLLDECASDAQESPPKCVVGVLQTLTARTRNSLFIDDR